MNTSSSKVSSYPFVPRWRLVGRLTTRDKSPLHIGSGGFTHRDSLRNDLGDPIEIDAVPLDEQGRVYLPSSTLKGVLRAWLRRRSIDSQEAIERVFGNEDQISLARGPEKAKPAAGLVEFRDASLLVEKIPQFHYTPPCWDGQRGTGVSASVAINRRTRTAESGKLFYHEFVPPGIAFEVRIEGAGDLDDNTLPLLLAGLAGFNDEQDPVVLGARTHDGWGKMEWNSTGLFMLDAERVRTWWNSGADSSTGDGYAPVPKKLIEGETQAQALGAGGSLRSTVRLGLRIDFPEGFLVRDHEKSALSKRLKEADSEAQTGLPDATPLRTVDGCILLPARSVRGVLRSQAERILRTLNPDDTSWSPLLEQLFGKTRHRSALEFTDFHSSNENVQLQRREFVAIDRFTAGVAGSKKFDAELPNVRWARGEMTLNVDRLQSAGGDVLLALGLLALVLRDLYEGDLSFGMGTSKGLGTGQGRVVRLVCQVCIRTEWSSFSRTEIRLVRGEHRTTNIESYADQGYELKRIVLRSEVPRLDPTTPNDFYSGNSTARSWACALCQ